MFTPGSRACAYKSASGRHEWPNHDPIGEAGGINLYSYVANNPINYVDPYGLILEGFGDWELNTLQNIHDFFGGKPGDMTPNDGYDGYRAGTGAVTPLPDENGNPTDISDTMLDLGTIPVMAVIGGPEREGGELLAGATKCKKFGKDANALIQLAKDAKRTGVSPEDAKTLLQWANEYNVNPALDHIGTTHWVGGDHIRIGPVNHIPVQ